MAPRGILSKKLTVGLQAICHLNKEQRHALLRKADPALVRCICECALNVLQGNVSIQQSYKSKLRPYKGILRRLSSQKTSLSAKKRLIVQQGGFLPALLAPILGTLVSSLIAQ